MAIQIDVKKDIDKKSNIEKKLGFVLPLDKSSIDGYFESTYLTLDAVKENVKNLLNTRKGERLLQPDLGLGLDKILFENITPELKEIIRGDIKDTLKKWLPFVGIQGIDIIDNTIDNSLTNKIDIKVSFFINNVPNMHDSVTLTIE